MKQIETITPSMQRRPRPFAPALLALGLALLGTGCPGKAAKTTPPVLVPSIESAPEPEPTPQTVTAPEPVPAPEKPAATAPAQEAPKPKPKPRKPVARKPAPPSVVEAPKPEPSKAVQPEASHPAVPDSSVQITAAVPASAMQSQRQNTEQLLRSSQAKLAGVNRPLSESERAMASQARDYINQSNSAIQEGEIERAYNLAIKASLLADELAK